jgi:hypothetical protein
MRSSASTIAASLVLLVQAASAQQACTGDPDCNDGNLCTTDACVANACVRTPDVTACGPAVDLALGAKKFKLRIPPGNPDTRGVRMLTTEGELTLDNLPQSLSADDPVTKGGSLRIFSTTGGFDKTYALPFTHWDYFPFNSPTDYRGYQYKDTHNDESAIGVVKIIADKTMKLKGKGQAGGFVMEFTLAQNPDPVGVVLALGSNRYCFQLGALATPPSERASWTPDKIFWVRNSFDAPASCPCAIDSDCDDGQTCSGTETCVAGFCQAGGGICP